MAARWNTLLIAIALLALLGGLTTGNGVMAESECLGDGESCTTLDTCPRVCCSGVSMRSNSHMRHCPRVSAVFGSGTAESSTNGGTTTSSTDSSSHWDSATASTSGETPAPASNGEDGATSETPSAQANTTSTVTDNSPTPTPSTTSSEQVDAFQSTSGSLTNKRGGGGVTSTLLVVVGAVAGCVVLVAAVMFKRKTANQKALDLPNSSYRGSDGSGRTPDNRSLVGMLDGGARATTDSMKQLPVLSMASREDAFVPARVSSPFGRGVARISSPANRGVTNDNFVFQPPPPARSRLQVAFVDVNRDTSMVPEKNGVVAL